MATETRYEVVTREPDGRFSRGKAYRTERAARTIANRCLAAGYQPYNVTIVPVEYEAPCSRCNGKGSYTFRNGLGNLSLPQPCEVCN